MFTKKAEEADAALREAYKKEIIAAEAAVRQEGAAQRTALEESLAAAAQEHLFSLTSPRPKLALTRARARARTRALTRALTRSLTRTLTLTQATLRVEQELELERKQSALLQQEVEGKEAEKKRMKGELLAQLEDAEAQLAGAREVRNAAEL